MTKKRDDTDEYVGEIKDLLDLRAMGLQGESRTYPTKKAWDLKQKIITKQILLKIFLIIAYQQTL